MQKLIKDGGFPIGNFISIAMGRPFEDRKYTQQEMMIDYVRLLQMGIEARDFLIQNLAPKAVATNVGNLDAVLGQFAAWNTHTQMQHLSPLTGEMIYRLEITNSHLEDIEAVASQDDIKNIVGHIDELTNVLIQSNIDAVLKDRMIKTLGIMRLAALRINVVGTEDIVAETERFMGQLFRAEMTERASGEPNGTRNIVERGIALVDLVEKVANLVEKSTPLILGFGMFLKSLPPA